jgi:hypothetical protein
MSSLGSASRISSSEELEELELEDDEEELELEELELEELELEDDEESSVRDWRTAATVVGEMLSTWTPPTVGDQEP